MEPDFEACLAAETQTKAQCDQGVLESHGPARTSTKVQAVPLPSSCRYGRRMAPGDLDVSFAGDGKKAIDFGGIDAAKVVLVQPNGRIIVAGSGGTRSSFCVVRLRGNGALDTSFGSGGKRIVDFGGDNESLDGAALRPDGKIVLAGESDSRVAVARLNRNGSLDDTFSGDGRKTFSWGPISHASAVLVLGNGQILLAGFSGPEGGNFQVARLNPNGALDTAFGTGGRAPVDFGGGDFGLAVARQPNGRILVAGRSTAAGAWSPGCAPTARSTPTSTATDASRWR